MRVGLVLQAAPSGADKTEKIKVIHFVEVCSITSVGNKSFANKMNQGETSVSSSARLVRKYHATNLLGDRDLSDHFRRFKLQQLL